jgi:UDP-GlcNAc:undecaprenyl-phosphate/decaprenyl-phosphate GlcNAc-1-phosphate transferase
MTAWFPAFCATFLSAFIATRGAMALGISDSPDEARKLHVKITPTCGGIGIIVGVFVGIAYLVSSDFLRLNTSVILCLGVSLGAGVLGLLDDIYRPSAQLKLVLMLSLVGAFSIWGQRVETLYFLPHIIIPLGPILGALGTVFWLLVMVNTVNFMDGANGMAMGCSGIGLLGLTGLLVLSPDATSQSLEMAGLGVVGFGACCGFLIWNAGLGRVFSGDVGSLFIGAYCGSFGVLTVSAGVHPLSVALCFLPMLVDVILTIFLRLGRGENVLQAHARHGYQMTIRNGASHFAASSYYWYFTSACVFMAIGGQRMGGGIPFAGFALFLLILCASYFSQLYKVPVSVRADDTD